MKGKHFYAPSGLFIASTPHAHALFLWGKQVHALLQIHLHVPQKMKISSLAYLQHETNS